MNYTEETALFTCAGDTLLGILAKPEIPAETGVIVIVGGPQYRVGSHRQFVLLSRAFAAAGYSVLRFDYRGMGDSEGQARNFQAVNADIGAAINALQERLPAVRKVALWGLCDGASAALLYYDESRDSRVSGLCLLNPWVRSELSLARTHLKHYYTRRLVQRDFWMKMLSGKVTSNAITGFLQKLWLSKSGSSHQTIATQNFQQRMARAWRSFPGHVLLLLSGEDYTAKEFLEHASQDPAWENTLLKPHLARHDLQGADHTFADARFREMVQNLTLIWLGNQTNGSLNNAN